MTDQEKEQDYEVNLHVITFTLWDISTEGQKPLQIENAPTEQQAVTPTEQNIIVPTHQQEGGEEQIEEDIESDNPEYAMTKENLRKIANEIATSRKKKAIQEKGKGKRILLLSDLEDEEELLATTVNILEDATKNKFLVET